MSEDPFEGVANNPPSLHQYLYAFGNPTVYVDPDGRQTRARQKEDTEAAQRRAFLRQFGGRLRRGEEPPIGTVLTTNVGGVRIVTPIRDIQGEGALGISGSSVVLISESEVKPQGVVSILLDGSDIETPIDQAESAIANFEVAGESLRRADETLRGAIGRRDPTIQALIEERAIEEIDQPGGNQLAALGEATRQTGAATESAAIGSLEAFDAVSTVAGAGGILKAGGRRLLREGAEEGFDIGSEALVRRRATAASLSTKPSSRRLGRALEEAGQVRPQGTAAHHIVAGNAKDAAPARDVLERFDININNSANGIFLPANSNSPNPLDAAVHSKVHTRRYYDFVNRALAQASTREEAVGILDGLRQKLLSGGI